MVKVDEQNLAGAVITRQALDRRGSIGSLYDIRNDKLQHENLFNEPLTSSSIITKDCICQDYFLDRHLSQKDTWDKFNIETAMQLSQITGLVQAVPEYLQQTKFDNRTVRITFVFRMKTKQQNVPVNIIDLHKDLLHKELQNLNATHYVSGVTWGRHILVTFEDTLVNAEAADQLEKQLMGSLKKTKINDGQIKFENLEQIISDFHSLKISVSDGNSNQEILKIDKDAFSIIEDIQSIFQQFTNGNEQQLEFELFPLRRLAEIFNDAPGVDRMIQEVSVDVFKRIENVFVKIMQGKRMINDFLGKIELWQYWIPQGWKKIIFDKEMELKDIELKTQNQLGILVKKVRYGEINEQEMIKFLDEFHKTNPCSLLALEEFLNENTQIDFKIEILSQFDTGTAKIKRPNGNVLLKTITSIDDFINNYYDNDVYLFHISNQWIERDKINWYKQLRCFYKLQETEEKLGANEPIFRVIDHDLHTHLNNKPNSCTIYYAHQRKILSQDVYRTISTKKLSPQQIRTIRMKNKFTTLSDNDIEVRHKKFIEAHPTGEMNKEEFIHEFQQLYPNGNPRTYCNYAFNSIDTDNSGTIGFAEFMSAVALTVPGDIDKQLALIFAVCDHDDSQKVSGAELIKFLEVVAELEAGSESIDPKKIRCIAKKIMRSCGKRNDEEEITKNEFIACLKNNYELCMVFLPVITKKLSENEISLVLSRHPTFTRDNILEWHKQFLNEHFDGELTKAGFIDEYKKLYPNGNPEPYCNYIFKAIDTDKSGMINFVEFTKAVALTQSTDLETRLKLIFSICDKDDSGTISRDEMVTTIEVIAELNHDSMVPQQNIQSIIDRIMTYCGESQNNDLTEAEFIDCCKNNEELCVQFLPRTAKHHYRHASEAHNEKSTSKSIEMETMQNVTETDLSKFRFRSSTDSNSKSEQLAGHIKTAGKPHTFGTSILSAMYGATSYTFFGESTDVADVSFDNTLNIALAVNKGEQLPSDLLFKIQRLATNNTDQIGSLNAKYILCAYAACHVSFIEPIYFENLLKPFTIENDTIIQCILWAFASTLPCTTILNEEKIKFLYNGFKDDTSGWCISFIFRKLSEDQKHMEIVSDDRWFSILNLLSDKDLNEQIRTTIIYTMINIFRSRKQMSEKIKREFEKLVIGSNIPKKILTAVLSGLYTIVTTGSSLEQTTLEKLRELMINEDGLVVERAHAVVDYLDNKRTLSSAVRYSFNSQVRSELTATQNTSVSRSEEECVEPTAKFLGLDNLLGKVGHLDRSFNAETQPTIVQTGDHQAWYRTTYQEIENLGSIAKQGNLKDQDFTYLLNKMQNDSWHFTLYSREQIIQMIAEAFRDSAKAGQTLPQNVIEHLIRELHETVEILYKLNYTPNCKELIEMLNKVNYTCTQNFEKLDLEMILGIYPGLAATLIKMPHYLVELAVLVAHKRRIELCRACSECLLIVVRNQHSINDKQMEKIEEILKKARDTQVKKNLIEVIALKVSKGHHADFDLSSIEAQLEDPSTCVTVSYLFFKAATVEKRVFTNKQMSILCKVGKSADYDTNARENCLWAVAYSIRTMSNKNSISSELIDDLADIFIDKLDSIRHAAAIAVCNYISESNCNLSPLVLERLAVILCDQDYGLVNNVLSTYLKLAKQKYNIPSIALNNISRFFLDNAEFDIREKSIWIMKYAVDNGQDLHSIVLDSIDHSLNDREFRIRNIAATVFIRYWSRKIRENEGNMDHTLSNRMNNLLLFFRNDFDRDVQKSALELIKNLVENNYNLPESLFELIEYCLYDHDTSIATNAVAIIASYSKRHPLRQQTIACLEYVLTIDTAIHPNVISILKTIVCQGHILSEKSIVFLGQLLFKSIDPDDIITLLTHADRHQPLPKNVNSLVQQHYFIQVLRSSTYSASLDKAYRGLLSFTDSGMQLSSYVLHSIFSLLEVQTRLLSIIVNATANEQRLNNEYIDKLSKIFLASTDKSLIDSIRVFTNLLRQNHEIPNTIIDSMKKFIADSLVNIYVIEMYQLLIERHKTVDQSVIQKILDLLKPTEFTKNNINFNSRLVSFFKAVAENQPNEVDQIYFPSLLQLHQSIIIRKDTCIAAKALAEHQKILTSETLTALIYLLNNDDDIEIQDIALQTLELVHSNNQIMNDSVLQLLDLIHDQNMDDNENFLKKLKSAAQAGLKLYDQHFKKLCHMLFSCDLNLKREAAMIIALVAANGQKPSNLILQAVYGTLFDETINHFTIQLLTKSYAALPSSVIDDLLYLVLYSNQTSVKEIARQILDNHKTNEKVMNFKLLLTMNKLTSILSENNSIIEMITSDNDHKIHTALKILQCMILIENRVPIDLLLCITSRIASHGDMAIDLLIVALGKGVKFDQLVCEAIEDTVPNCRSSKIVTLLRILAGKQFVLQLKTLIILFMVLNDETIDDTTRNNALIALEYSAQHQALPNPILLYFVHQLSNESNETVRRSFDLIRHQFLKSYVKNPIELLKDVRIPDGIDYEKLFEMKSLEQRLGTVLTLLSVSYIDMKIFDLPVEQWSRELLCFNLLAEYPTKTPNSILAFYHHLTLLEQYKNYQLYNDNRDTILLELIRKKRTTYFDLSTINQIFIYLQTSSDTSIEILRSNDSCWLIEMRKFFIQDKLQTYLPDIKDSKTLIDHLIDQISQLDHIPADLIEPFLRIMHQSTHILRFLDMIKTYQITHDELINLFANDKYTIDRKSLMKQLEFIILNKTLKSKWTSPQERLDLIRNNLRKMMDHGWTFTKMNNILMNVKKDDESLENMIQFIDCLNIVVDYKIDESIEQKLSEIFSTVESQFWIEQVHSLVIDRRFGSISSEKNLQMLLTEMRAANNSDFSNQFIQMLEQIDRAFNSDSSILQQGKLIKNWTKSEIKNWAKHVFSNYSATNFPETMAVIKQAIYLDSTFTPRLIQILSILIILDPNHTNGRLLQILTGEGKSSIVSMLAVIKALQGKYVDIVTSSVTLAKRDAQERINFYSMFNLTVAHNNDETSYVKGLKTCYAANIVYGTSSQFQFDILRDEFSLLGTRQGRRYDVVIIDEVDSMLIDENNTIARLADHLPGMEWLNSFLFGIWQCISANSDLLANKNSIIRAFKDSFNDPQFEIKVPNHLHRFVLDSIPIWIEHAIRAKIEYKLDHHYMIKADETRTKRIVPIDFSNTGVVQCSTTWSDGLHQFLQIKHGLKMTPLTVTTNFLSNTGFFTRYKNEIYGLTGTIGSEEAKDLLHKIYHVDTIIIPPFKQKRHFQLETILKTTDDDWLKSIVSTTVSHANNKQAVLIICETRLDAKAITKELQHAYPTGLVRLYTDNTDATEANVVSNRIQHGEIIVATNLAGRGTDLKTSQEVENNGGLHVCLTFLPNNLRVEEQAIGRTSRQGNRGTSQMILSQNRTLLQLMSSYPEYLAGCTDNMNDTIKFIRDWRAKAESANIERIWKKEIPEIQKKDHLFRKFCKLLSRLRNQNDDFYRLLSVKERWGLWLKSMDQVVQNRHTLEQLTEVAKFRCIDVPRDGNSFLHALSRHFQGASSIDNIKNTIVEHMKNNKNLYKKNDAEDRHWATCRALNINIVLFSSDFDGPYIYKRKDAKSTCFLGYETDTQYILLESLNPNFGWEESFLTEIDIDNVEVQQSMPNKLTEHEQKQLQNLLLTRIVPLDLHSGFDIFQNEICKQYGTNEIIKNACYLMIEADDIIAKLATWSNWIKSFGDSVLPIEKAKTVNDAIDRLERAIKLDPNFAFSASANRAYLVVNNDKSDANYKITAKKYLMETQKQIEQYILPQMFSMQVKSNGKTDEFVFDDLAMQIETKIEILHHYQNHIKQAISVIESSQKLIDVHSRHDKTVDIGRKLYRNEVKDYVKKYSNTIELTFYNLTVTEDMFSKTDQAIQLLELLPQNYEHVSMNYLDMNLEVIEKVTSKANLSSVCLHIQYLNIDEVHDIIGDDLVTLSIAASTEQHQHAIQNSNASAILVETDSQRQYLSADQALSYLKNETNNVKSISFESLNQATVNTILNGLEKIAISLVFTKISMSSMKQVCKKLSKPFTIQLSNLSISKAQICINETMERNFTMSLCELKANDACKILEKFDRNEQDINTSLKSIAEQYMKADQSHEELTAYRNMGISQFIIMQELNPRPWISICTTAGLGLLQIAGGICLVAATGGLGVQLGIGLITEGVSDIYYAIKGAMSRNFSWKDYAIQKGISLALCFVTLGCSAISQAAKTAQTASKGGVEFFKQTLRGTGTLIKNSARTLATGAIQGTATTSFKLALKQVSVVCIETGVRELANYSADLVMQNIVSPLKPVVNQEIERITNIEREKEYYNRILCRTLAIDAYYGNDDWRQKLEEIVVKILTKQNSAFIAIAKSLGAGISNAVIRHTQSFSKKMSGNSYLQLGANLLTVIPAIKGSYEITAITDKFFATFEQELAQLEQNMPTFEHFLHESDPSMTQQTATEIHQLLERHHILNQNGMINIELIDQEDTSDFVCHHSSTGTKTITSARNSSEKLMKYLNNVKFSDEQQKNLTIKILSKYRTINPRSLKAGKLQKKIIDMLTDQVMMIIQSTIVGPLENYVVGSAVNALSQKIQLKLDSNGTIHDQLMQEGAQRYIANLSNDFYQNVQSGKIQIPSDIEKKLNDLIEKSQDRNFKPQNSAEELALAIVNNKQGGVIEIGIIAAMTGKSISVIQSDQIGELRPSNADITDNYSAPQIDKQGNIQEGHHEEIGGNAINVGPHDCLYAAVIGKTSNTFTDIQDMRQKCAAFVLANPAYIMGIQPAVNIINGCSNPIRRQQLLMEGGCARPSLPSDGTYRSKRRESKRLTKIHNVDISGETHESEHPIPCAVLTSLVEEKPKNYRDTPEGKKIEGLAPAYYERTEAHRAHIGTGTKAADASSMTSVEYRDMVKKHFIDNRDPGTAIQLNQLNYAFQEDFQEKSQTPAGKVAHDSYLYMLQNTSAMPYYTSDGSLDYIPFPPVQKAEAYLARFAAETGQYPSVEMHKTVKDLFNA